MDPPDSQLPKSSGHSPYEELRHRIALTKRDGLPRAIGLRELLILMALCSLLLQIARWCGVSLELVFVIGGLVFSVLLAQARLFRGRDAFRASFLGGGLYGVGLLAWYARAVDSLNYVLAFWPLSFAFVGTLGILVGTLVLAVLRFLVPLESRPNSTVETINDLEDVLEPAKSAPQPHHQKRVFLLFSIVSGMAFGCGYWIQLIIFAKTSFYSQGFGESPPDAWVVFLASSLLFVGWAGFTVAIIMAPAVLKHPADRAQRAFHIGGTIMFGAFCVPILLTLTHNIFWGTMCLITSVVSLGAFAYGFGYGSAMIVRELVPEITAVTTRGCRMFVRLVQGSVPKPSGP